MSLIAICSLDSSAAAFADSAEFADVARAGAGEAAADAGADAYEEGLPGIAADVEVDADASATLGGIAAVPLAILLKP